MSYRAIDPTSAERERRLVDDMTLEEKIRLCVGASFWHTAGIDRLGIPGIYMNDGPHGVRATTSDAIIVTDNQQSTCFPTPSAIAASWDADVIGEVAHAVGVEARAHGLGALLAPGMNLQRSPLGGRNFEYFSEDPYLTGVAASAYVAGVQAAGVAACVKHFVGNDQERDRMTTDIVIDPRALREVYLAPFARCISDARPAMVMASYNRLNGEQVAESYHLLTDVLRHQLGFDGVIISDWGAVTSSSRAHLAGLDLEMPPNGERQRDELRELVSSDFDARELLDARADRIVSLAMSNADRPPPGPIPFDDHYGLARRCGADCVVLLRNDGTLPLTPGVGRVAVVGPMARHPRIQGRGSSLVEPERVVSPWDALRAALPNADIDFAAGCGTAGDQDSGALRTEALRIASGAHVTIVFVGLPDSDETEGADRRTLDLAPDTQALVEAFADHSGPVVLVTLCGSPVRVPRGGDFNAIVHAGLLGGAAGDVIVDTLLGVVAPGGRLAQTWPSSDADLPISARYKTTADSIWYSESVSVGHRHYDTAQRPVDFAFGHGLSYTAFAYDDLIVVTESSDELAVRVRYQVTNCGDRAGKEVPQLYISSPFDPPGLYRLRRHCVLRLDPGETHEVVWRLSADDFSFFDDRVQTFVTAIGAHRIVVGASSRDHRLQSMVDVPLPAAQNSLALSRLGPKSTGREFLALSAARPAFEHAFADLVDTEVFDLILDMPLALASRLFPELVRPERVDDLVRTLMQG